MKRRHSLCALLGASLLSWSCAVHEATPQNSNAATTAPLSAALEDDLAILRAHDQRQYNASPEVMRAARDVFDALSFVGRTEVEVTAMLGAPVSDAVLRGERRWEYQFHNGELGVFRVLVWEAAKVSRVEVILTQ